MKKSILALIIASTLMLSGCEEQQKLKESIQLLEHANLQLKRDVDKLQAELQSSKEELEISKKELETSKTEHQEKNEEFNSIKSNLEEFKEKLANTEQSLIKAQEDLNKINSEIPTLTPKQSVIFAEQNSFKNESSDPENSQNLAQSNITYLLTIDETNHEWLNTLLYKLTLNEFKIEENPGKEAEIKSIENPKEQLIALWNYWYNKDSEKIKNFEIRENNYIKSINYVGQRKNILTFNESTYVYEGGAHGMFSNRYFNIDSQKKVLITLNDIFTSEKQNNLANLLWNDYEKNHTIINDEQKSTFIERKDFYISKEFYFSPYGIHFVYPPYELGPYSSGEIQLKLSWDKIQDLITEEYNWAK